MRDRVHSFANVDQDRRVGFRHCAASPSAELRSAAKFFCYLIVGFCSTPKRVTG